MSKPSLHIYSFACEIFNVAFSQRQQDKNTAILEFVITVHWSQTQT